MDGYTGEVKLFAGTYPPANWAYCQGQILEVAQYVQLFAIVGSVYGGNGTTNFGLPDLRGRIPIGSGTGTGLSTRYPGMKGGYERIYLYNSQLPAHYHKVKCDMISDARTASADPEGNIPATATGGKSYGTNFGGNHLMHEEMLNTTGNDDWFDIIQPSTVMNYIICLEGQWPPRT